jgi:tetratricopeptide (TPR) repeat protein
MSARSLLLAVLAAASCAAAVSVRAQDTAAPAPSNEAGITDAQGMLDRAIAEFGGAQQGRSIILFDQAIDRLEGIRRQGNPSPRVKDMLVQAYEYRARAYYGISLTDKATESFRALIQVKPSHTLSKEKVSPKIVDFFNNVKKAMVGYLAVSSKPPGARVTLNGEFLSLTDFFPQEVLAGEYTVEIARDGYMTDTRSLVVGPKETVPLSVSLTRTAASLFFMTEPGGVEVWIDGTERGTTGGSLDPQFADAARGKGLDPQRASARLEVGNVTVGGHVIELRKRCYETVKVRMDVTDAKDYDAEPVKLEESLGALKLTSDPPGARIFLDGEMLGHTPKELEGICSGKHRLEVKHTSGKFVQDVTIARNEALAIDCPIRPTLAFLGAVAEAPSGERVLDEAQQALVENLSKIKTLNFITAPRETVDHILDAERLTRKSLIPKAGTPPDTLRKVTEKLAAVLEVQGFLIAVLPDEKLERTAVLHLLAAGNASPDSWEVTFAEKLSYLRFLAAVDQKATLYRPWSGLITVDTLVHTGVPVLRVAAGSPAAQAQIEPGSVLYSVGSKPIARTSELIAAIQERKPKDALGLHFRTPAGTERAVDLKLDETPQELPLNDPSLLYNKVMMDLRQQVEAYPGTEGAALARLNLALCAMHFGDFAAAHEHLLKAKVELPQRPGISQGTALYYLGLAMERLGYTKEAGDFYRSAAGFKDATLFNNDGPAVAPLAARRAGAGSGAATGGAQ